MSDVQPSDMPYPPGSPEGREWTRRLIAWQTNPGLNPGYGAAVARADERLQRVGQQFRMTPSQLAVDATVRDVIAARRPSPGSSWHLNPGELILTPEQWAALGDTVRGVADYMRTTLVAAFDAIMSALAPAIAAFDDLIALFVGPPRRQPSPLLAAHRRRRHR